MPASQSRPTSFPSGIRHGDVLSQLKRIDPAIKFDVVIIDPPYNIGKDFGNTKDTMPMPAYVEWSRQWLQQCFERLAPNGIIYLYGFAEILARLAVNYPIDAQRWLVWHYTNKTVPSSKFWQRSHESILSLWHPDRARPTLEIDQIREAYTDSFQKNAAGRPRKETLCRYNAKGRASTYTAHPKGAMPRDVLKVPALAGGAGRRERWFLCRTCNATVYPPAMLAAHRQHDTLKHPTQKPMQLTKRLIQSRVNGHGGRVLIPFAGSGSECVVAKTLNLEFVGIEINPDYVEFARKWLAGCC